jgi:putative Ca2+/H+ antiporter (TMEM165/GDT1 family)
VSRDEYHFNRPENQISTFCLSADGSQNIWLVLGWNIGIRICYKIIKKY